MRGYLRDFWRQLRALVVVLPLLGLCALSFGVGANDQPVPTISSVAYYFDEGLHLFFFVGSETGQPIPSTSLSVLLAPNIYPPSGPIQRYSAATGSEGLARVFAPLPVANYSVTWYANNSAGSMSQGYVIQPGPNGTIEEGSIDFSAAKIGFLTTHGGLSVFSIGPGGAAPSGYSVNYRMCNSTLLNPFNYSCGTWTTLGALNGYSQTYPLSFTGGTSAYPNLLVEAEVVAANGSVVASTSPSGGVGGFDPSAFPSSAGPTGQATRVVSFVTAVATTYVGFVAVLLAFSRYGRDRVSRVLESVLWRPVTQSGLLLERFASSVVAMALMIGLGVLLLDAGLDFFWKVPLPTDLMMVVFGTMTATSATLIGLVVLASHLLRSVGGVIGVGVGLLVVFYVAWTPVLSYAAGSGAGPGTPISIAALVNPTLLPALAINVLANGYFLVGALAGISATASVSSVVVVGTAWVVAPILAAALLSRFRD